MISIAEAAKDESIFRPDGFIVIPRSDGDPTYIPPNMICPPPSAAEVNYYHEFKHDDEKHHRWRSTIGEQLAKWFKLPSLSPNETKWRLHDFPKDYMLTEQRKGKATSYRTDPYLFGSQAHRFRSTMEALEHFVWLIRDPKMDPSNCVCKYCSGKKLMRPPGSTSSPAKVTPKKKAPPPRPKTAAQVAAGKRGPKPKSAMAEANSILIRGVSMNMPAPGVTIASVPLRDREAMKKLKQGQREGFRVGEVAWCKLEHPVVDPTDPTRQITQWPVLVADPNLVVEMDELYGRKTTDASSTQAPPADTASTSASTEAAVAAAAAPDTPVGSSAAEASDTPAGASAAAPATESAHQDEEPARPDSVQPASTPGIKHRQTYRVRYLGAADTGNVPESALTPFLAGFIPDGLLNSCLGSLDEHPWLEREFDFPQLNLERQEGTGEPEYTSAIVAFAFAVQTCSILRDLYNPTHPYSTANTATEALADLDPKQQTDESGQKRPSQVRYQGIYLGTERIWVGEVVRLKLSNAEIQRLERELNAAIVSDKPVGSSDPPAVQLDKEASYVMRLNAIYRDPRAASVFRVAGEVFQILTASKYHAIQARGQAKEEEEQREREEQKLKETAAKEKAAEIDGVKSGNIKVGVSYKDEDEKNKAKKRVLLKLPQPSILSAKPGFPAMPPLPDGFMLVPLTDLIESKLPKEVCMPLINVAGRIYPSYGQRADGPRVEKHVQLAPADRAKAADEDTQDELRARLSVAGFLNGCVKAMGARRETISRAAALKASFEMGRGDIIELIRPVDDEMEVEETLATEQDQEQAQGEEQEGTIEVRDAPLLAGQKRGTEGEEDDGAKRVRPEGEAPEPDDDALPEGWVSRMSKTQGKKYYIHIRTRKTQWNFPTAGDEATEDAPVAAAAATTATTTTTATTSTTTTT